MSLPNDETSSVLYKILSLAAWQARAGTLPWSDVDRRDGYLHLSAPGQLRATAEKWFAGRTDLIVVEVDANRIDASTLRWEGRSALSPCLRRRAAGRGPPGAPPALDAGGLRLAVTA